jgi:hypothetical protein
VSRVSCLVSRLSRSLSFIDLYCLSPPYRGFDAAALPHNYLDVAPNSFSKVRKNIVILRGILDAKHKKVNRVCGTTRCTRARNGILIVGWLRNDVFDLSFAATQEPDS